MRQTMDLVATRLGGSSGRSATIDAAAESVSGSPIEAVRFPDIAPYEDNYTVLRQSGANPLLLSSSSSLADDAGCLALFLSPFLLFLFLSRAYGRYRRGRWRP